MDESYLRSRIKKEAEFNCNDLITEHKILTKTKSVGIYIFPEPQRMPEAKYGLLFFDFKKKTTTYYTLEKSITTKDGTDEWMIGLTPEFGKHLNLGSFDEDPILDVFLNHVYNKFEKKSPVWVIFFVLLGLLVGAFIYYLMK